MLSSTSCTKRCFFPFAWSNGENKVREKKHKWMKSSECIQPPPNILVLHFPLFLQNQNKDARMWLLNNSYINFIWAICKCLFPFTSQCEINSPDTASSANQFYFSYSFIPEVHLLSPWPILNVGQMCSIMTRQIRIYVIFFRHIIFVKTFDFDEDQIASYDKLMQKNPGNCKKVFLPLSMSQVNLTLLRGCFLTNLIRVISWCFSVFHHVFWNLKMYLYTRPFLKPSDAPDVIRQLNCSREQASQTFILKGIRCSRMLMWCRWKLEQKVIHHY